MLKHASSTRALFAQDPARTGQLFSTGVWLVCKRMSGGGDQDQLILSPGTYIDIRVLYRPLDKTDVHTEVTKRLNNSFGIFYLQFQTALGLGREKCCQPFWQ
ncbi:hypothetical protein D3C87_1822090 [compost metagenome]